jgi:hypothetical protein
VARSGRPNAGHEARLPRAAPVTLVAISGDTV